MRVETGWLARGAHHKCNETHSTSSSSTVQGANEETVILCVL